MYVDGEHWTTPGMVASDAGTQMQMTDAFGRLESTAKMTNMTSDGYNHTISSNLSGMSNGTGGGKGGSNFFDVYYSTTRFSVETGFFGLAVVTNCFVFVAIKLQSTATAVTSSRGCLVGVTSPRGCPGGTRLSSGHRYSEGRRRSPSFNRIKLLFLHMAMANLIFCVTLWLTNNILFFFHSRMVSLSAKNVCLFYVYPTSALFVSASFGIAGKLIMLGFVVVQYLTVCRPLACRSCNARRRLHTFIGLSWLLSILAGLSPSMVFAIAFGRTGGLCQLWILTLTKKILQYGGEVTSAFDILIYVSIIFVCSLIYFRMKVIERELARFRFAQDARIEMKAIATIAAILVSMTITSFVYIVVHRLSLNGVVNIDMNNPVLIYYMLVLPYVKLMFYPLIYGLRMHEILETMAQWKLRIQRYVTSACACACCWILLPGCCSGIGKNRQSRDSSIMMTSCYRPELPIEKLF